MGFSNHFLNLIRLYITNWDIDRVISKYAKWIPNICLKYCIHFLCKNRKDCKYDHIERLRLPDIILRNKDYEYLVNYFVNI